MQYCLGPCLEGLSEHKEADKIKLYDRAINVGCRRNRYQAILLNHRKSKVEQARSFSNAEKVHFLQNKLVDLFANIVEHLWPRSMIGNSDSSDILLAIF